MEINRKSSEKLENKLVVKCYRLNFYLKETSEIQRKTDTPVTENFEE